MKILVVVLLAVAAGVHSNMEQEAEILDLGEQYPKSDHEVPQFYNWGTGGGSDDRMIASLQYLADTAEFHTIDHEVTYRGDKYTNITLILVRPLDNTHYRVVLKDGGINENFVTLGFIGHRSRAVYSQINIYAAINCHNN